MKDIRVEVMFDFGHRYWEHRYWELISAEEWMPGRQEQITRILTLARYLYPLQRMRVVLVFDDPNWFSVPRTILLWGRTHGQVRDFSTQHLVNCPVVRA